jgi:hypothetical protein
MTDKRDDEVLKRTRRIETRLTQFMIAMGVTTEHQKPTFDAGSVGAGCGKLTLPSPHTSVREMLDAIPETFDHPVEIFVGDQLLAVIRG